MKSEVLEGKRSAWMKTAKAELTLGSGLCFFGGGKEKTVTTASAGYSSIQQ